MAGTGMDSLHVSQAEKQAILERQAIRDNLRRGFQRQINDPTFKGFLIDPAVERWNFARHRPVDFFKPTPRTIRWGILFGVVPPLLLIYGGYLQRKWKFESWENGTVPRPRQLFFC